MKTEVFGVGLVNCQTAGQDVEEGELEPHPAPGCPEGRASSANSASPSVPTFKPTIGALIALPGSMVASPRLFLFLNAKLNCSERGGR